MPIQNDELKGDQEEQAMDTSGPVSSLVMNSDGGSGDAASSAGSQSEVINNALAKKN